VYGVCLRHSISSRICSIRSNSSRIHPMDWSACVYSVCVYARHSWGMPATLLKCSPRFGNAQRFCLMHGLYRQCVMAGPAELQVAGQGQGRHTAVAKGRTRTQTGTARGGGRRQDQDTDRNGARRRPKAGRGHRQEQHAAAAEGRTQTREESGWGTRCFYSRTETNKLLREEGTGRRKDRKKWATAPFKDIHHPLGITPHSILPLGVTPHSFLLHSRQRQGSRPSWHAP